jgi:hypothetical protein
MTALVSQSRARCLESARLLADSRLLIARSRRLLNPAWGVAGASDWEARPPGTGNGAPWPPYELACLVRDRITSGKLPVLSNAKCWAGPATGKVCAVCEQCIVSGAECEVGEPNSAVFAHLVCHSLWCKESQTFHRGDSTAA